jgi:hypothetical protein
MTQTAVEILNCKGRQEMVYNQKLKAAAQVSMERFLEESACT